MDRPIGRGTSRFVILVSRTIITRAAFLALVLLVASQAAYAQATGAIAGVVKDPSGAVLPGVTVEATSSALIERVRTAVTDGEGQYKLLLLPSGAYDVKFSLTGFSTVVRQNVDVSQNFTATVNSDLKVGTVSETITVSGEAPIIDVQRANQARALTADHFEAIPSGKTYANMAVLIPAINFSAGRQDVGGADGHNEQDLLSAHGSRPGDATLLIDGLKIGNMISTGDRSSMQQSPLLFEQVNVQYSGNLGEAGSAAPQVNSIIKSGGNTFHTTFYFDGSSSGLQQSNLTSKIVSLAVPGQAAPQRVYQLLDFNGAVGGPIVKNRVWFFTNGRYFANGQYVPGTFFAADPAAVKRVADISQQAYDDFHTRDASIRLTLAAGAKNKFSLFYDNQEKCNCHYFVTGIQMPEASSRAIFPVDVFQATWTYTASNKVLIEAGISPSVTPWSTPSQPGQENLVPIVDTGTTYRNQTNGFPFANINNDLRQVSYRASLSYVTGSHSVKVGWDMMQGSDQNDVHLLAGGQQYTFVNGLPTTVTIYAPIDPGARYRLNYNMGTFVQDQWTFKRLTATGGIRIDMQKESVPAFTVGPSKWLPNRNRSFDAVDGVPNWKDIDPRFGVAFDVFGNGKTALKVSASRGVAQETDATVKSSSPLGNFSNATTSAARTWNDNGNFVPDCNLADLTTTPGFVNGECGPITNASFALANGAAAFGANLDPNYVSGWGKRPYDWEFSTSIQQEIRPRVSLSVGYFRRVSGNFVVTDNQALTAANFSSYKVLVPNDPRLPGAGQATLTLRDVNAVIPANNIVTTDANLGLAQLAHWNGVDANIDARLRQGLLLQGGLSTGKTMTDNCAVATAVPETAPSTPLEYCHNETPFLTNVKALAAYTIPRGGVRVAAAFQNIAVNPPITATVSYVPTLAFSSLPSINGQLGRIFNGGPTANVNVITPNSLYNDRLNQLDLKVSKFFKIQKSTLQITMDVFNAFNSDSILNQNFTYGSATIVSPQGTWLRPTSVLQGRFFKFGARVDF